MLPAVVPGLRPFVWGPGWPLARRYETIRTLVTESEPSHPRRIVHGPWRTRSRARPVLPERPGPDHRRAPAPVLRLARHGLPLARRARLPLELQPPGDVRHDRGGGALRLEGALVFQGRLLLAARHPEGDGRALCHRQRFRDGARGCPSSSGSASTIRSWTSSTREPSRASGSAPSSSTRAPRRRSAPPRSTLGWRAGRPHPGPRARRSSRFSWSSSGIRR